MSVEVLGVPGENNGYGDSMDAFRNAHADNSRIILNLAFGRRKNDPAPKFDPDSPDNAWPIMVYHPEKGHRIVGVNLLGLVGGARKQAEADNKAALAQVQKDGYRLEPYLKPQIAVLDPAVEKAAALAKNAELEGKIVAQADELAKLRQMLEKLLAK
jgi:hypothetical protein